MKNEGKKDVEVSFSSVCKSDQNPVSLYKINVLKIRLGGEKRETHQLGDIVARSTKLCDQHLISPKKVNILSIRPGGDNYEIRQRWPCYLDMRKSNIRIMLSLMRIDDLTTANRFIEYQFTRSPPGEREFP